MLPVAFFIIKNFFPPLASFPSSDFFQNIINDPFNNSTPLVILAGVCIAFVAGIIYLARRHIEKQRGY